MVDVFFQESPSSVADKTVALCISRCLVMVDACLVPACLMYTVATNMYGLKKLKTKSSK
jgi:hypothetical protein